MIVDFHGFPTKLIELLELSLNSSKEDKILYKITPFATIMLFVTIVYFKIRFGCVFETKKNGETHLKITETNQFKSLVHLSLKFKSATDDILKAYLATKLQKERLDNEDLRIKNSRLEENVTEESH